MRRRRSVGESAHVLRRHADRQEPWRHLVDRGDLDRNGGLPPACTATARTCTAGPSTRGASSPGPPPLPPRSRAAAVSVVGSVIHQLSVVRTIRIYRYRSSSGCAGCGGRQKRYRDEVGGARVAMPRQRKRPRRANATGAAFRNVSAGSQQGYSMSISTVWLETPTPMAFTPSTVYGVAASYQPQ